MGVLVMQNDKQVAAYVVDGPRRARPAAYVLGDVPAPRLRPTGLVDSDVVDPAIDLTSPYRTYRREKGESLSAVRGLLFGMLFALPVWGLLVWGAVALSSQVF